MRLAVAVILLAIAANWLLGLDGIDGDTGAPVCAYEDTCPVGVTWDCETMGNRRC